MWVLSDDYYISISQLRQFEEDKVEWWKKYVGGGSSFRQTLPMGVGTCFDWLVKKELRNDLNVKDEPLGMLKVGDSLDRGVDLEEEVAEEAWKLGRQVLEWYKACGAYAGLVDRYVGWDVWLNRDETVYWDEVRVRGKSDLTAVSPDGSVRIGDWKVRGSGSEASPSKGWSRLWTVESWSKGVFPGSPVGDPSVAERDEGSLPAGYADQLGLYGIIESSLGRFVEGEIYECVCRKTGVRVAEYVGTGTDPYSLYARLLSMWRLVRSNSVLTDEEIDILESPDWLSQFGM